MQTITMITSTLFACSVVLTGCGSDGTVPLSATKQWRSQHFDVSAALTDGWRETHVASPGDTFDRPNKLLVAFANNSGPYGYIIKMEKDVPFEQLSLEDYIDVNRSQYTSHPAYELVDESDIDFHGHRFHRFRFKATGTKGATSMYVHIFRNGHQMIGVQWVFPISGDGAIEVPQDISNFDKGVTIAVDKLSD